MIERYLQRSILDFLYDVLVECKTNDCVNAVKIALERNYTTWIKGLLVTCIGAFMGFISQFFFAVWKSPKSGPSRMLYTIFRLVMNAICVALIIIGISLLGHDYSSVVWKATLFSMGGILLLVSLMQFFPESWIRRRKKIR